MKDPITLFNKNSVNQIKKVVRFKIGFTKPSVHDPAYSLKDQ